MVEDLHCHQCGRHYSPRHARREMELFCAACGGVLYDSAPPEPESEDGRTEDAYRGSTIGGARLKRRLAVRPTRMIYRAYHRGLKSNVCVEVFPNRFADQNVEFMQLLFAEAAETREVRNIHVVTLLDLGRREDCWFTMSDYHPKSLRELLEDTERLPVRRTLELAEGMLLGLQAIHEQGLLHGNVSPDGVFVAYDGSARLDHLGNVYRDQEFGRLVVTDGGSIAGPALYCPPERPEGNPAEAIQADLYSLGATMFEMLAGRPPVLAATAQEVRRRHREGPPPVLAEADPQIPERISDFVAWLMATDPSERPESPQEALEDLREGAVDLSKKRQIDPVEAAVSPSERKRSAVAWGFAWTVTAAVLVVLAVIPIGMMCQEKLEERRAAPAAAQAAGSHNVFTLIHPEDPQVAEGLPPDRVTAVRALLDYRLAFYPELPSAGAATQAELPEQTRNAQDLLQWAEADHLLAAAHSPGFGRRNWKLTFVAPGDEPWKTEVECSVEGDRLAPLEEAAAEILEGVARHFGLSVPDEQAATAGLNAAGWLALGEAVAAEREGRWPEALQAVRRARKGGSHGAPLAVMGAYYRAVTGLREDGRFPEIESLPQEALPSRMAALARMLPELAGLDAAEVRSRLGDLLAENPHSARGYFLLGAWRLFARERPGGASFAFRQAARLDPANAAATRLYVELTAPKSVDRARAFIDEMGDKLPEARLRRLKDYARQFAGDGKGRQPGAGDQ